MAASRLEKIGTILSRINGLIKTGAMKWEDRPIWYDIYEKFPPKDEPRYDRPAPDIPVKGIFYDEDKIRALYHKNNKNLGTINLSNNETQTKTMKFIEIYQKLEAIDSTSKDKLYENALSMLNTELEKSSSENIKEKDSLVSSFKEAQEKQSQKVDVSQIFKD